MMHVSMNEITQEMLQELIDYDPDTGLCFWKPRSKTYFKHELAWRSWTTRCAGKRINAPNSAGYLQARVFGNICLLHRVIWMRQFGFWPNYIDHINGNPQDNRILNLRDVDNQTNSKNSRRKKNNNSGVTGVSWDKVSNKWRATIVNDGRQISLGRYDNIDDAAAAYKNKSKEFGFHENHGRPGLDEGDLDEVA